MSGSGDAQIDRIRGELDACDERLARLAASCAPEAWPARPPSGGWSPSECVQHLVLSVDAMLPRIDAALADGRTRGVVGRGPFGAGLLGRILLWSLEPPYRMKSRTAAAFVPTQVGDPVQDGASLREAHDRARRSLEQARGLALDQLSIASPFAERLRYNLYTAFALLPVHARRHLWQAEQAIAAGRRG